MPASQRVSRCMRWPAAGPSRVGPMSDYDKAKKFAIWSAIAWVPFAISAIIFRFAAGGLIDNSGL